MAETGILAEELHPYEEDHCDWSDDEVGDVLQRHCTLTLFLATAVGGLYSICI